MALPSVRRVLVGIQGREHSGIQTTPHSRHVLGEVLRNEDDERVALLEPVDDLVAVDDHRARGTLRTTRWLFLKLFIFFFITTPHILFQSCTD